MLAADHAAKLQKPIVMVKVGRTETGSSMAQSHTGHLTGSDAITSAVFRQLGITRVDGLDELLEVSAAFARNRGREKPPRLGEEEGGAGRVRLRDLRRHRRAHGRHARRRRTCGSRRSRRRPRRVLHDGLIPAYLRVSNPVDCGGPPVADSRGRQILDAIVADPKTDIIVVPITGAVVAFSEPFTRDLIDVAKTTDKPIFVVWGSPPGTDDTYYRRLLDGGLPGVPHVRQLREGRARVRRLLALRGAATARRSTRRRSSRSARGEEGPRDPRGGRAGRGALGARVEAAARGLRHRSSRDVLGRERRGRGEGGAARSATRS